MEISMKAYIFPALRLLLVMTVFTGIVYPVAMTFFSLAVFPYQARGSMIRKNGVIIGSELIGQKFMSDKYFSSRPSGIEYNPMPSCGTNWGPTDRRLADSVSARRKRFIENNFLPAGAEVPKEMLFASASGVDPHISPDAALMQTARISRVRGLDSVQGMQVRTLVQQYIEPPQWNVFGQERVNVLKLNLALDHAFPSMINKK
jgi:potassium-transporting ATPase KdpC subunit